MNFIRGLTIINILRIFGTASKLELKNWPIFSNLNPFPSVATGDRKLFQYLQIEPHISRVSRPRTKRKQKSR